MTKNLMFDFYRSEKRDERIKEVKKLFVENLKEFEIDAGSLIYPWLNVAFHLHKVLWGKKGEGYRISYIINVELGFRDSYAVPIRIYFEIDHAGRQIINGKGRLASKEVFEFCVSEIDTLEESFRIIKERVSTGN